MVYDFGTIFASFEDEWDWKDFCYHVAKDHTYRTVSAQFLNKLDAFQAWRNQMEDAEKAEKKSEVLPFRQPELATITGGKDGEGNWLLGLEEGCVFVCRNKKEESPVGEQWHVSIKWKKSVVLYSNFPQRHEIYVLVIADKFSRQNELVEILQERRQEEVPNE